MSDVVKIIAEALHGISQADPLADYHPDYQDKLMGHASGVISKLRAAGYEVEKPVWEFGHRGETLVGVHSAVSEERAVEDVSNLDRYWKGERTFEVVRRRKACSWQPVAGEA